MAFGSFRNVLLLLFLSSCDVSEQSKPVRIDAALNDGPDSVLLFSGDSYITLNDKTQEDGVKEIKTLFELPPSFSLQAAYMTNGSTPIAFLFGNSSGAQADPQNGEVQMFQYDDSLLPFDGSPDAVSTFSLYGLDLAYIFKGCSMYVMFPDNHRLMSDSFIPFAATNMLCDVDAAWENGGKLTVLKGDRLWLLAEDNRFDGPRDFHADYNVESWTLQP